MEQNKLFRETRWRLAIWYSGVMGVILTISALGVYEAIAHAHRITIDREVESVASTLKDTLEPSLKEAGKLEPEIQKIWPSLCFLPASCLNETKNAKEYFEPQIYGQNYYIIFLDNQRELLALGGDIPEEFKLTENRNKWYTFKAKNNHRYRQITLLLQTEAKNNWGYLQLGRSMVDFDDYMAAIRWIMLLGLPVTTILVSGASWWLAGLAMKPIYQSYRQIQQFTADAAHELRTPLAAIRATVESSLRLSSLTEEEIKSTLEVVQRQNYRLSQLVGDLLLLTRMDRQILPLTTTGEDLVLLQDAVNDILEELAALARRTNVELKLDFKIEKILKLKGNETQLYRAIINLVTNAINYTPHGGRVILILDCSHGFALIKVQDTGIGIGIVEQKRIFERFYRVEDHRSRNTGGFGLGLPIAKAIALSHGGNIEVESELGKGSTFTMKLPYIKVDS